MSKHDQAALDAATQIIDLFSSPGQWRDTWHLKHKVQCLLIDLLERNATQPAAGDPVAWIYEKYIGPSLAGEHPDGLWSLPRLTDERPHSTDRNVVPLYASPPAAAHGEEIESLAVNRYRPTPDGLLHYKVVAGDGRRSLFTGTKAQCYLVAAKLTEAFLDGAYVQNSVAQMKSASAELWRRTVNDLRK